MFALLYTDIETTKQPEKAKGKPSRDRYVGHARRAAQRVKQKKCVIQVQMAAPCSTAGHAFSSVLAAPLSSTVPQSPLLCFPVVTP